MITKIQLLEALISFLGSFSLAVITIPLVINWVKKNHLLDNPNERASHSIPTPTLGGIGFMPGIVLGIIMLPFNWEIGAVLLSAVTLFTMGILDDTKDLKASRKLLIQLGVGVLLFVAGIRFNSFNGLLGIQDFHWFISLGVTVFFFAGIINSFNLIDGIDGLAAGVGLINSLVYAAVFYVFGEPLYGLLALVFAGALAGFLVFNFNPAQIFMGDTGSLLIGLFMSVFFLKAFSTGSEIAILVAFATILFPAIDMCRLFVARMLKGKSPFKADKEHYHHLLMKAGDNHKKAALTCYALQIVYISVSVWLATELALTGAVILFHVLSILLYALIEVRFYVKAKDQEKEMSKQVASYVQDNNLLKQLLP